MKKLLYLCVVLMGCETANVEITNTQYQISGRQLNLYVIDSCEYLGRVNGGQSDIITHKGNCKYCTERQKVLYEK